MAEKRRGGRAGGSYENGEPPDDEGPYNGEEPQGPGNPDADPARIHREYVQRRLGGGEQPTPERYRQAVAQWHALPGSIGRPPVQLGGGEEPELPGVEAGGEPPDRSS